VKIAFFGPSNSFDYYQIGGTNSYIRRLSKELQLKHDCCIDYIIYGSEQKDIFHMPRFYSRYFTTFNNAINALMEYDHVVTVYLPVHDVIKYGIFCQQQKKHLIFHMMYWVWPESFFKRNLMIFINAKIPINGVSFTVSPRLFVNMSRKRLNCQLLMPPVPINFFLTPQEKSNSKKTRVTFIGRIDIGKGVLEILKMFKTLKYNPNIQLKFYGTFWEQDIRALEIHESLSNQNSFEYIPVNFNGYSDEVDKMVCDALRDTDIFLQPYRKLSSTIDMPVLILEAMASLCAVITTPLGDIPTIYPKSALIMDNCDIMEKSIQLIQKEKDWLSQEREKIFTQNEMLKYDTSNIGDKFWDALMDSKKGNSK
jgi:glycosyltransferase involved in cell wall biosynthesis